METTLATISIIILIVLLIIRVPIAFALGIAAMVGVISFYGWADAFYIVSLRLHGFLATFSFSAVPLFLIMSYFAMHAGFGTDAFNVARLWVGRSPGGLASATVVACAIFSAASGSGICAAAALSRVAIPEMIRFNYSPRLAAGVVAAIAPLDALIPPSIALVIYGTLSDASISKLLLAAIFPGLLAVVVFIVGIFVWTRRHPEIAPAAIMEKISWRERILSIRKVWGIFTIFAIVMGTIYFGWATSTEAAALGAFGALILALAMKKLSFKVLRVSLYDTVTTCAMIFLIIGMAFVYSFLITRTGAIELLVEWVVALNLPLWGFFAALIVIYLLLGLALDGTSMMVLTLPAVLPVINALGLDPVWFGVIMVLFIEISEVTPPLGLGIYVVKATVGDLIRLEDIFKGTFVFFFMWVVVLILVMAFPEIALWLPSTMQGSGG